MTGDDVPGRLEALGERFDLGEYEVEAYLAVLEYGTLTAAEIADETGVPQPRVYDTVRGLADRGLVEVRDSRPMEVLAVDPEEAFEEVRSTLDAVVDELGRRYSAPARGTEAVSLVTSRRTVLRYLEDVVAGAEYELLLSLTPDLLARFEDDLAARREAGVAVELLVSPAAEVPDPGDYDYGRVATVASARRGVRTPVAAVADGSYSVYTARTALEAGGDGYAVIFDRSELGFLVSGFLNTVVWPTATTLAERDDDRPFPRRYATVRRCVREIAEGDGPFHATVRGRDVETGDYRTVSGEVVDASLGTGGATAALTLHTGDGTVDVGGQAAAVEDVEAHELAVGRDGPPELPSV